MPPTPTLASNTHGSWIFIAAIEGLDITKYLSKEIRIGRTLFVHKEKLPFIRNRLGIQRRISELKKKDYYNRFFNLSDTYAIIWATGKPELIRPECLRILRSALYLLTLSQLGYSKRRYSSRPSMLGELNWRFTAHGFISRERDLSHFSYSRSVHGWTLVLDGHWNDFQKKYFFFKLVQLLYGNGKWNLEGCWLKEMERAALLIGQSLSTDDIAQAFLWNMIALELLLTRNDKDYKELLPKRAEAFLGWATDWKIRNYEDRIKDAYLKRCGFVHAGKRDDILIEDLLFTDDLVFNLLNNIIRHIKLFRSKDDVIAFSEKVAAERILGCKSKARPKSLLFLGRRYTKEDLEKI